MPRRCSPRPGSWIPPGVTTRWTCSTPLPGGLLARADRAGTLGAAAVGPARAGPGRPGQRRGAIKVLLDPPASGLPAGGRDRPLGVPRAARRRRVGRPALLNNQGVATGSWGAASPRQHRPTAGPGDEAEQSKLRSSRASAFLPSGIAPTGLAPRGPRTQQQRRLPRRAPLALACAQGLADTGQRSTGPRPGGLDPRPDPGQDPADQRQNQDREQPTTKSHGQEHDPRLPGAATRHTRPHPSATSAVPDPESASIAAPPSRGRRRRTAAVGGRQQRVPTPE